MYYKISMRAGHHGIGQFAQQSVYVSAKNVLQAFEIARRFPSLKHHRSIPLNTVQISEDEYIANAVIDSRKKHFDNEIVPLHIDIIIKKVLPSVIRERKINPNGEKGKLAPKFFELCYEYKNATSDEQKEAALKTLNDWIVETYQSQEDASFQDESGRF